jgi:two-component system OmpR family response regulator
VRFDGWSFDRMRRELTAPDGTLVALSGLECRLLDAFIEHAGQVLSRDRLIDLAHSPDAIVNDRSVDLAVSRLRAKLGDSGRDATLIRTMRGEGYLFDAKLAR